MPPPDADHGAEFFDVGGNPQGPIKSAMESPALSLPSWTVDFPTSWKMRVIVPASGSASAMVSGIRSPSSLIRRTTNCPGFLFRAISGAAILNCFTAAARSLASTI